MKKLKISYKIILTGTALMLVAGFAAAWRVKQQTTKQPLKIAAIKPAIAVNYDHALLDTFRKVSALMDLQHLPSTYSGTLNITDKGDSTRSVSLVPFLFSCRGNDCYYRYGNTETLNAGGYYLYIDRDRKKVLVGAQKSVAVLGFGGIAELKMDMVNEHYQLSHSVTGKFKTIRFVNERHVACREYALSYDTAEMKIKRIYVRLTDPNALTDRKRGQIIDIHFTEWFTGADIGHFLNVKDVIEVAGDNITLQKKYSSYQVISIH